MGSGANQKRVFVVSLSGGLDSAVMLGRIHVLKNELDSIFPVFFNYGSKHNQYEMKAARLVASHYGLKLEHVDLTGAFLGLRSDLLKSGGEIPEGHYQEKSMARTVVPGRNMVFLSVLAGIAWSETMKLPPCHTPRGYVWMAVHAGDHAIYPDCRPEFVSSMMSAVRAATDGGVMLSSPFLHNTKAEIVRDGAAMKVPFHLTRTCYKDQPIACGKCGSCQERLEAFVQNGFSDPIDYESREILPKV